MKNFFTRYHPRFVRSLVYMLQASEYSVREYLRWYKRTTDFLHVERRKRLVATPKAVALIMLGWMLALVCYGASVAMLFVVSMPWNILFFVIAIALTPHLLRYAILIPLICIQCAQIPLERQAVERARQTLLRHPGIKIAIAGSFGKTSMREMLKTVLAEGKKVACPPLSYNTPLGISRFVQELHGDEDVLIFELGEYYPGDVKKLCALVQPSVGIITGVNEAHLEKFGSLERTTATIFELADWLGEKTVYVNKESALATNRAAPHHMLYSRAGVDSWIVRHAQTNLRGTTFTLSRNGQEYAVRTTLLGLHQVGPLVVATDIAAGLGMPVEQILRGIAKTVPFDHRLEPKEDAAGVMTLDDSYNGNPDGVRAVIAFLGSLAGHRRWYVTPGLVEMGSATERVHRDIGRLLAQSGIEKVVLIKNSVTPFIEAGLKDEHYAGEILWFDDALAAFAALPHLTVKGDVVLLQNDWPDQYA